MEQIDLFKEVHEVGDRVRGSRKKITEKRSKLSQKEKEILRRFGCKYFDTELGYGGYYYDGRFKPVAERFIEYYGLDRNSRILEVGCAKGFFLIEFYKLGIERVCGVDISEYAISQSPPEIRQSLAVMNAVNLEYKDNSFDLVVSKDVIHNLIKPDSERAIREMMRVSRKDLFLEVAVGRTPSELEFLRKWGVTMKIIETPEYWENKLQELGYWGDYYLRVITP